VVATAPAVRAVIGEVFRFICGNEIETAGKIVTALRSMSFAKVFDISFAVDGQ
jgi:NADH-quinone oxidoreductase subunit G